jgi:hypothetical protein
MDGRCALSSRFLACLLSVVSAAGCSMQQRAAPPSSAGILVGVAACGGFLRLLRTWISRVYGAFSVVVLMVLYILAWVFAGRIYHATTMDDHIIGLVGMVPANYIHLSRVPAFFSRGAVAARWRCGLCFRRAAGCTVRRA